MMDFFLLVLILAILAVVLFDYTNGFHDASNIVATMISSGAMTPQSAIILASLFEFLGPLLGGTAVAFTMGTLVDAEHVQKEMGQEVFIVHAQRDASGQRGWRVRHTRTREEHLFRNQKELLAYLQAASASGQGERFGRRAFPLVFLAGILGAILWNLLTWYWGLPSSSSHALVGGLAGATLAATGQGAAIRWGWHDFNLFHPHGVVGVLVALLVSPLLGFLLGAGIHQTACFLLRWASPRANVWLRRLQWITSAALAFSHGTNDGQKSMGVIALLLFSCGYLPEFEVPFWVKSVCALAIALGTLSGGWRIMRTVGRGIFKLRPLHSFSSQFASAAVVLGHALIGGPVSTTHVVSSTVMGVGIAERKKAVRWSKVGEILVAWSLTVPATGIAAAGCYALLSPLMRYL